jgi:hypothetical protein
MLMWGPCAVWLACTGHWGGAIFLVVYGAGFVGTLDNVIRTYVLQSNVTLHPLLAFVSVLGGLQLMGFWGVFIGPVVAALLHGLIKIFNGELVALSLERQVIQSAGPAPVPATSLPQVIAPPTAPDSPTTSPANDVSPVGSVTIPPAPVR